MTSQWPAQDTQSISPALTFGDQPAGDRLVFRLRTRTTGPNADQPQIDLAPIPIGQPSHVAVTYTPGRLVA